MILISCIGVILSFCVLFLLNREHKKRNIQENFSDSYVRPFSVAEYFDRMEKEHLAILKETEDKEEYTITLRLGFDELKLNNDGTTEWISKRPKKPNPPEMYISNDFLLKNMCCSIATQTESQRSLLDQLQANQLELAQAAQTRMLISSIQSVPCSKYIPSFPAPYCGYQNSCGIC